MKLVPVKMVFFLAAAAVFAMLGTPHTVQAQAAVQMKVFGPRAAAPPTPEQMADAQLADQLRQSAAAALDKQDYATAASDARQSVAISYGDGRAQEYLAAALYGEGNVQQALQEYQKLASKNVHTYTYAFLLLQSDQWAKAVTAYDKALSGDNEKLLSADTRFSPLVHQPNELKAAILIGWARIPSGDTFHGTYDERNQQAQAMFEEAAKLAPDSAVAQYYVGYGLQQLNRRAEAKAAFAKAAGMGNSDVKACVEAGCVDGGANKVQSGH